MLKKKIQDAFNKQINEELASAYVYLSMSAQFEDMNLSGMASWMMVQAQEELGHVMKFYGFINERGGRVRLSAVAKPKETWKSPLEMFEDAYKHECKISRLVDKLVDLALSEKDHAANAFLQWFVTEQVEEEASALAIVEKMKLAGDHTAALLMIDKEVGARGAGAE